MTERSVKVSLTLQGDEGHISSDKDLIIPHTLLPFHKGGNGTPADNEANTIRALAIQQGWTGMLDKEALGIMQMLSHFVDWNVFNGTKNVFVDDIDCPICCLTDVRLITDICEDCLADVRLTISPDE